MLSQSKQIEALTKTIEELKIAFAEKEYQANNLLRENQDLQNQLRDMTKTAEERLKIISTLPDLNNYCEIKAFESKVRT